MRSLLLKATVSFILLNAAVGVAALLFSSGDSDDFEMRVLFTTLTLSAATLVVLPAALVLTSPDFTGLRATPFATILASFAGFGMLVAGIWSEPEDSDFFRVMATLLILGLALSHSCLLSLARLQASLTWVRFLAVALAVFLAAEVLYAVWADDVGGDYVRLLAITAILTFAASLLVPVLRFTLKPAERPLPSEQAAFCPRCGARLNITSDRESTCPACRASFRVVFIDP